MSNVSADIILVGGGGHCRSVIDVVEQQGKYRILGIVDTKQNLGQVVMGHTVIACDDQLDEIFERCKNALITVGHVESNHTRVRLYEQLKKIGFTLPVLVSPFAYVSRHATLGEGTVVMHHAVVNVNAKVGINCIVNTKALIEHDAVIGNHCHIATAGVINGGVNVKENTFFGSNATSRQGAIVNRFTKAGAVSK